MKMMGGRRRNGSKKGTRKMRGGAASTLTMQGGAASTLTMQGGKSGVRASGSHAEVWHGQARHTSGGLTKRDLMKNKHGRIVSRKKHALGKRALKHLVKAGFKAKKGTFKLFRK